MGICSTGVRKAYLLRHIIKADVEGSDDFDFGGFPALDDAAGFAVPLAVVGVAADSTGSLFGASSLCDFFFLAMLLCRTLLSNPKFTLQLRPG
jgi:hypothetical protein